MTKIINVNIVLITITSVFIVFDHRYVYNRLSFQRKHPKLNLMPYEQIHHNLVIKSFCFRFQSFFLPAMAKEPLLFLYTFISISIDTGNVSIY